ncbi:hypothetical protein [Actinoalloteichus spitiensis]|uniref:hypothetical protein n=1 Tax=Actinoalloteichus spitiensis TaxID=252394 RepID=UPI00068EE5B0|nr:hypothetical protein [Actinoalloteichus spitiensis]
MDVTTHVSVRPRTDVDASRDVLVLEARVGYEDSRWITVGPTEQPVPPPSPNPVRSTPAPRTRGGAPSSR